LVVLLFNCAASLNSQFSLDAPIEITICGFSYVLNYLLRDVTDGGRQESFTSQYLLQEGPDKGLYFYDVLGGMQCLSALSAID
jgi:hypothetical protein